MEEIEDIFTVWPSQAEMARELGVPYQTVAKWHQRGRIPQEAWSRIIECAALREKLITVADLLRVNGKRESASAIGSPFARLDA